MELSKRMLLGITSLIILITATVTYTLAQSSSTIPFTIYAGIYPGSPSYTIWAENGNYFAKNAYGAVEFSGTDASTVIQSAINALTNGGTIFVKKNVSPLSSTININNDVELNFESSTNSIVCSGNPTFLISGGYVKIIGGYFTSSISGNVIFKVVGGTVTVEFKNQKITAPYNIERAILPYLFEVTNNFIDVKVSDVYANTKYLFKIKKDSANYASRMSFEISNIAWKNEFADGIMMEFIADTHGLYNVVANNINAYNTGKGILIHTANNGHVADMNFANCIFNCPNAIHIFSEDGPIRDISFSNIVVNFNQANAYGIKVESASAYISDIAFSNVQIYVSGNNASGFRAEAAVGAQLHSIHASNLRIAIGTTESVVGVYIAPAGTSGADGQFFIFEGLRIYDAKEGQISIYTNDIVRNSMFSGCQLYLEYAQFGSGSNVRVVTPNTVKSGTASGTSPITVAHGLAGTPQTVVVTPRSSTPCKVSYTADATNIYIYHDAGSSITVSWYAEYKP